MAKREIFGQWSAAGRPPVEGRLLVDDDGRPHLQLRGRLPTTASVTGVLESGLSVTLFGMHETKLSFGTHFQQELLVSLAVLGLEIAEVDDACLSAANAEVMGLEDAVGLSGLALTQSMPGLLRSVTVEWTPIPSIEVGLSQGTLALSSAVRFDHESYFRFALEHNASAQFHAKERVNLADVDQIFNVLHAFVGFATEGRTGIRRLIVTRSTDGNDQNGEVLSRERLRYGPLPHETEPWLTLSDLEDPEAAMVGFYDFAKRQPAAFLILYEYLVFAAALNPIDKLLYLTRFLEVFHRTRFPGRRDPDEVHERRVALVKQATGGEHTAWGNHITFNSNEVFFKDRVRRLAEDSGAAAAPALGGTPVEFARVVGNCRNYWTHYADALESKALRDIPLDDLDDRLLLLVRACVLEHMSVSRAEARSCLHNDRRRWEQTTQRALEKP